MPKDLGQLRASEAGTGLLIREALLCSHHGTRAPTAISPRGGELKEGSQLLLRQRRLVARRRGEQRALDHVDDFALAPLDHRGFEQVVVP